MNNVVLMGRLTRDPELRTTPNGVDVTSFTVAVDRKYTPKGEERKTDFFDCVAWRQTATFVSKWFSKGSMIAIQGELQNRSFEDKDGNKRIKTEIIVDEVNFCGDKAKTQTSEDVTYTSQSNAQPVETIGADEDLPF